MKFTIDTDRTPQQDYVHINTEHDIIEWQCSSCRRNKGKDVPTTLPKCFALSKDKNHCSKHLL